ncbi:VWA domain-containing protein [Polyangium aurulentum]|uniref:VWA domain-containing protein n=1 Tax=Polyangium aurulentum TaxID=2567896 RepID=UPI0010AE9DBC|nr:VWA domain-containing protein [Polyangium aurulentum]UQA59092.1 VWA domain-containing protein [Polyangium aurulentum]
MSDDRSREAARRLRLLFGRFADASLGRPLDEDEALARIDEDLSFVYDDRAYRHHPGLRDERGAGLGPSVLRASAWLARLEEVFPEEAIAVLQRDAADRLGIAELLADPDKLSAVTPSPAMLALLLRYRSQIPEAALPAARRLVEAAVRDLEHALALDLRPALTGAIDPRGRSRLHIARNLDARRTIRDNLKNYDAERQILGIERLVFRKRLARHARWRVIVLVDQSGSMLESVVQAALVAAVFASVPAIDLRLLAFDTHVVDMTELARDPVEVLFSVQLGGGTLIERAVGYAATLVSEPRRTLIALISDFREGGPPGPLFTRVKDLVDAGVKMLGIASLGRGGAPDCDQRVAGALAALGMPIGAMTPRELAAWVGKHVRGGEP